MRIGISYAPAHNSPEEWAKLLANAGCRSTCFPVDYRTSLAMIDEYVAAAAAYDIRIAEVGIWNSPFVPDKQIAERAAYVAEEQLRLADYVQADCCVNISGAFGPVWDGCYRENYTEAAHEKVVAFAQNLIDKVRPTHTCFTLEPMQWMLPSSPEEYKMLIDEINRDHFAVHLDMVNFIKDPYVYTHQDELMQRTFELLKGKIKSVHLKDCRLAPGSTVVINEVMPGTGAFDIPGYLTAIRDNLDAETPVLVEHLHSFDEYLRALAYVRGVEAEVMHM